MRASIAWPSIGSCSCAQRQRLARGDAQLPLDQVEPGDHLGHRMLDLQPRVHLHEVEAAVGVGDELDRAGADVADRLAPRRPRPRPSRRGARPSCPARALPRAPSGGGAAPSSRARTGRRSCRACRRRPGSRCGAACSTYCSTSTRSSPKALLRLALARGERGREVGRARRRGACPCRRRRRWP